MALGMAIRRVARQIAGHQRLRATMLRLLLREDEIVPFGRSLAFDPHTWVIKQTDYGFRIWVALGERSISREIMLDTYERDEVAFVQSAVHAGDSVVDSGRISDFIRRCSVRSSVPRVTLSPVNRSTRWPTR